MQDSMATEKKKAEDARKAKERFVDQPGQWIDKTPASVKRKRANALKKLAKSMKKK